MDKGAMPSDDSLLKSDPRKSSENRYRNTTALGLFRHLSRTNCRKKIEARIFFAAGVEHLQLKKLRIH